MNPHKFSQQCLDKETGRVDTSAMTFAYKFFSTWRPIDYSGVGSYVTEREEKYKQQNSGSTQKWGVIKYIRWAGIENAINVGRKLINSGSIEPGNDVITPFTDEEGESKEFYENYANVVDAIADLTRD